MTWAIVTLTSGGASLGSRLHEEIPDSVLYVMPGKGGSGAEEIKGSLAEFTAGIFGRYEIIVFIMATGIVVRMIAGLVKDKTTDPGIVVMDEKGRYAISLLSGHIGGANSAAEIIARKTGAVPVITTASDVNEMISPDMLAVKYSCIIDDMQKCRNVTAIMVNGGRVELISDNISGTPFPYRRGSDETDAAVYLTNRKIPADTRPHVHLIPRNIYIGTGCRRGTDSGSLIDFIIEELEEFGIDYRSIVNLSSITLKNDEPAIYAAAEYFHCKTVFFSAGEINEVEGLFPSSEFVKSTAGVGSVSGPAACLASGRKGNLILTKKIKNGMTLSIAEVPVQEII